MFPHTILPSEDPVFAALAHPIDSKVRWPIENRNQSCACALERADGSSNHDGAFDITAIAFKTRSVLTELATQPWKGPSKHLTFETMER